MRKKEDDFKKGRRQAKAVTDNKENRIKRFLSENCLRILISACLILAVFVMPLLTEARYRAYLNSFSAVIAKEYYFSSDYLKEDGADYLVSGWNGKTMMLDDIQIRNYDNTLLTNQNGQDLKYKLTWDVKAYDSNDKELTGDEYKYNLKVSLKSTDERTEAGQPTDPTYGSDYVVHLLTGNGQSKRDVYSLELEAPEGVNMADGSYVKVFLSATNSDGVNEDTNQYKRTIKAVLRYNVSVLENFINKFEIQDQGSTVITTISTSTIPGEGASQRVYMWWDTDVLDINWYNYQFNQLFMSGKYEEITVTVNGATRNFGLLEISATSLSLRTFEFENESGVTIGENEIKRNVKYDDEQVTSTVYLGYYLDTTTVGEGDTQE